MIPITVLLLRSCVETTLESKCSCVCGKDVTCVGVRDTNEALI